MTNDIRQRYENAKTIMQGCLFDGLTRNTIVLPYWISDSMFWYRRSTAEGHEFRLVDAKVGSNEPAFDHSVLASALKGASGRPVEPAKLPLLQMSMKPKPREVHFYAFGKAWRFTVDSGVCEEVEADRKPWVLPDGRAIENVLQPKEATLPAPDGNSEVFLRDHNFWLRDLGTGKERALTDDGEATYRYGASSEMSMDSAVQARWSPDSKRLFTVRLDTRGIAERPAIHYVPADGSLRPQLKPFRLPYPEDEHIDRYELKLIDVASGDIRDVQHEPVPRTHWSDYAFGFFSARQGWWSADGRHCYFVEISRGSKSVRVLEFDGDSGAITRTVLEETDKAFVKMCPSDQELPLFLPIPETDELIWFSERTGMGHLYLYDLAKGDVKRTLTEGDWQVRDVTRWDNDRRELIIQTAGRDAAISPYYRDVCRLNIDTGALTPLITGDREHLLLDPYCMQVWAAGEFAGQSTEVHGTSPGADYFVVTHSRADEAGQTVLIDRDGRELMTVETPDISALPKNWQWPEPVTVTAADGKTPIHGVVFRPPGFTPSRKYAVLDFNSSMRSFSGLPQGSFTASPIHGFEYHIASALAAIGFVVVYFEGRGMPLRGKAFQQYGHGDASKASEFQDRVAGLKELAKRWDYMDLDRVGIAGTEPFTNNVFGILQHPDFYKVCVEHCFVDPRFGSAAHTEPWYGRAADFERTGAPYAEDLVEELKGKLMLITGLIVPLSGPSTFRLVEALQKANKDFDMLVLPNLMHQMASYTVRREWDYFVEHLLGETPPAGFHLTSGLDAIG